MKNLLIVSLMTLTACLLPQTVEAQKRTETTVEGIVLDSLTHEGEPYATVRITAPLNPPKGGTGPTNLPKGEAIISSPFGIALPRQTGEPGGGVEGAVGEVGGACVTDMQGRFSLAVKGSGDYLLTITSVGRNPIARKFTVGQGQSRIDLGTMYISEASELLEGVEIVAQKPLVKMDVDQISYSVQDDPESKTNTLLDMLRKVPMVTVDGEDNIKVNGSSSFQVYVNGRPNAMMSANPSQTLKAMPATGVKSIEVLTNPGAKYDAEGVGGILNITMEGGSSMEGYNLSLNAMAGNTLQGGGAFAQVQTGRLTLSANVNANHINIPDIDIENVRTDSDTEMDYRGGTHGHQQMLFGNFDASYEIDTLNTITASVGFFNMPSQTYGEATNDILRGGIPSFSYDTRTISKTHNTSVNGSIDYLHTFRNNPRHTLALAYRIGLQPKKTDATSLFYIDGSSEDALIAGLTDRQDTDRSNMKEHTLQADYTLPLAQGQELETGAKYVMRRNSSESDELDYRHNSDIAALYASYALHTGPFGLKAGLRYEHTDQRVKYLRGDGTDFSLTYDNLVPTLSTSYSLGDTQQLAVGYNLRIARPGIGYLNPYVNDREPTHVTYGNPALDPEKVHTLNLSYSLFTGRVTLNANLRHSFLNNGLEEYTRADGDILYTTYDNIGRRRTTELSLFLNWNLLPSTRATLNGTTSYVDLRSPALDYHHSGWQHSVMLGLQHTFPCRLRLSANYFGNTQGVTLQGKSAGFSMHTLSLSRSFLRDDRLNVSLTALNPFHRHIRMDSDLTGHDFTQQTRVSMPLQSVMVGIQIRIGNLKPRQKAPTATESDIRDRSEENSQINSILLPR